MSNQVPEALAVLDREIVVRDDAAIACRADRQFKFAKEHQSAAIELQKVRNDFADLLKAAQQLVRESDYPIPHYFIAALAASGSAK